MASATLLYPATYTIMGRQKFVRDVPAPVAQDIAAYLDGDPRFLIDWQGAAPPARATQVVVLEPVLVVAADPELLDPTALEAEAQQPGNGTSLAEALDLVDGEVDANFDPDGKPGVGALSLLVGRPVSVEERDRALAAAARIEAPALLPAGDPTVDPADGLAGEAPQVRSRIIRKARAETTPAQLAKPDPTTEGASEI